LIGAYRLGGPVIDGKILPASSIGSPFSEDVPLLIGGTRTERTVYDVDEAGYGSLTMEELRASTAALVGEENAAAVVAEYRERYPDAAPYALEYYIKNDAAEPAGVAIAQARNARGKPPTA
jgi:hypothetical protein